MNFEWDRLKADANLEKHGVSFKEAATAFGDPLSLTIADPDHSDREDRFILIGHTFAGRLVVAVHTFRGRQPASLALDWPRHVSDDPMSKKRNQSTDEMREEYDFSAGVRGKYADHFREGSNVIVLEPDLAAEFPTAKAVNQALRKYLASKKGAT